MAEEGRVAIKAQKARSDTMFLLGLLLGGPMMAIGGNVRPGLLVVFGAGLASVIRGYSGWSTMGAAVACVAFVGALTGICSAIYAETRGAGDLAGECGEYPSEEVCSHLAELGVRRVVVAVPNRSGRVCSFSP
jgi:hypothetical protein